MAERSNKQAESNYHIAPGDEISLSVRGVDELSRQFSVERDGSINLPLIGEITAANKTEKGLAAELRDRLSATYLQSPDVTVSVKTFQGRRVAVLGAVQNPGYYPLQGSRETIADVLNRAGGVTEGAGPKLFFSPAGNNGQTGNDVATATNLGLPVTAASLSAATTPIEIDLIELYKGRVPPALNLPVRGGDTLLVQQGGKVYVEGWVKNPGPFPLSQAMTLTQAITKAGGLHFGASPRGVTLTRREQSGAARDYRLNYGALERQSEEDVFLQPGDRVEVAGNPAKVSIWGVYNFFAAVVNVAIGGTISVF
jgi:polysaccharide export outer membrane protein